MRCADLHGFLGIENKAAIEITKRADGILARLDRRFPGNSRPIAGAGAIPAGVFTIDLAPLASDPDGNPIAFAREGGTGVGDRDRRPLGRRHDG